MMGEPPFATGAVQLTVIELSDGELTMTPDGAAGDTSVVVADALPEAGPAPRAFTATT